MNAMTSAQKEHTHTRNVRSEWKEQVREQPLWRRRRHHTSPRLPVDRATKRQPDTAKKLEGTSGGVDVDPPSFSSSRPPPSPPTPTYPFPIHLLGAKMCLLFNIPAMRPLRRVAAHTSTTPELGNESVPKIVINDTKKLFFLNCNQHFGNFKP